MTTILSELPKTYSDLAKTIIQQHLRRNTSGSYYSLVCAQIVINICRAENMDKKKNESTCILLSRTYTYNKSFTITLNTHPNSFDWI